MTERKAWAHIAHRNGVWCAVVSAQVCENPTPKQAADWKKSVVKDIAEWIVDGWEVMTVYSREEYQTAIDSMRMYDHKIDSPEAQASLL